MVLSLLTNITVWCVSIIQIFFMFSRLPPNADPYILNARPNPLTVTVKITNRGPDFAGLLVLDVINPNLTLSRVSIENLMGL